MSWEPPERMRLPFANLEDDRVISDLRHRLDDAAAGPDSAEMDDAQREAMVLDIERQIGKRALEILFDNPELADAA